MVRTKINVLFIFILWAISWQHLYAQIRFEQISGDEGLSQNTVRSIIQDKHGFIWIGTYNGINKYDGNSMVHYNYSTGSDGLSSNIILSLFEDSKGDLWAGTADAGLNRIDTETGKISKYFNVTDSEDFSNDVIAIHETKNEDIFFKIGNSIRVFRSDSLGKTSENQIISEVDDFVFENIRGFIPAANGNHWVFSPGNSKFRLSQLSVIDGTNPSKFALKPVTKMPEQLSSQGYILQMIEYPSNTIWMISSRLELTKMVLNEELEVIDFELIDLKKKAKIADQIYRRAVLKIDNDDNLWIAGDNLLLSHNLQKNETLSFEENEKLLNQIGTQQAQTLLIDQSNILWLGTLNNGIYKLDLENNTFLNSDEFTEISELLNSPFHKYPVLSMCEDLDGNVWLGTQGEGGIAIIDESELSQSINNTTKEVWDFKYITKNKNAINDQGLFEVKRLMPDSRGNVWAASRGGISKMMLKNNVLEYHNFNDLVDNNGRIIQQTAFALEESFDQSIWGGYWNGGLINFRFDSIKQKYDYKVFQKEEANPSSLSSNAIRDILEDSSQNIWVGTMVGLNKLVSSDTGETVFEKFLNNSENPSSLSNNYILDIYQARDGTLFIGTFGGGLNKMIVEPDNSIHFEHITAENGLPDDIVSQISEDVEGNLWLLHVREISKLDRQTGKITYFKMEDGFHVSEFKDNAMMLTSKGIMVCGGANGITFFQPNKLSVNEYKPKLAFTDFRLFNESVKPGVAIDDYMVLEKDINLTSTIELPFALNSIEFNFASLHFSNPSKNSYQFMLEGFEDSWQTVSGIDRNFASYPNLPFGEYIFKVLGSNNNGVWMEQPREIAIKIFPPWYLTAWAIALFSLIVISVIYISWKVRLNQIKLRNELKLEHLMHEKSDELNKIKLQFFTNISHELRTPLTLIIGPLQQILKDNTDKAYLKKLNLIMYKNSVRLLKLINQLLDFRKAESGNINLLVQHGNISFFVEEIYKAFEEIALEKQIKFVLLKNEERLQGWFDADKIEKILYNLLSNAFKYTPKGKSIKLVLEQCEYNGHEAIDIQVIDYGIGIPKKDLNSIFERFYQAKNEDDKIHLGSGLGLAYTKHLVEIHGGSIEIESELHKGTSCFIKIPVSREAYQENAILEIKPENHKFQFTQREIKDTKGMYRSASQKEGLRVHAEDTPCVLIVEDNVELNEYLVGFFNQEYNVLTAFDGAAGLEMARKELPEIIISDLMMPKMGGIEMCKIIKTDFATSHIPVIILTAKAGIENEKEGLETGAEEFVLKPFNIELLKLRVDNIIRNKQLWVEKFKSDDTSESWKELSNKLDQEFLEKGISIVKSNIDNSDFTVAQFALEMGMSRSSLFSKLKSITKQSTSEFIRNIRLKKAATMLKMGRYSITEVVFMTGFSDPKYFRTCFKKLFNKTPSEFLSDFKTNKKE